MSTIRSPRPLIPLLLFCSLAFTVLPARSQSTASVSFNPPAGFAPPPGHEAKPANSASGGRRGGQCSQDREEEIALTPLTPLNQIGLTTSQNPSIFVVVPKTSAAKGEFLLRVPTENPGPGQPKFREVYYSTFDLPDRPGAIRIQLPIDPQTQNSLLELNKTYQWEVSLICNPSNRELDVRTSRWIQRVEPSAIATTLEGELATATPLEQVSLYSNFGIWHDALATLVDLRSTPENSERIASLWAELLNSEGVQLGNVAQADLLNCCLASSEE